MADTDIIWLVEITAAVDAAGTTAVLRYASGRGHVTGPAEVPANTVYDARVVNPGNFERHLWRLGATRGQSQVGYGVVLLNNADGALDGLLDYGFDRRPVTIRRGPASGAYPGDFPVIFSGTMDQVLPSWRQLAVRLRDRLAEVAGRVLQPVKYAGSNVLPDGVEGIADDLKGKPKPLLYGTVKNIAPPCVNTSKLIYQLSSAPVTTVAAVYDRGAALALGVARASLAALLATAPTAGKFDWYLGAGGDGAFIRLGSSPAGMITVDAAEGATAADRTAAQIAKRLLTGPGGIAAGEVSAADVTALDTAAGAELGWWRGTDEGTVGEALDAVLGSVGGWWMPSADGTTWRLGRLELPSGTPVLTILPWQILGGAEGVEFLATADAEAGVPAWRVRVGWQRNWTVQRPADLAGVALPRQGWLAQESRYAVAEDAAVQLKHPSAPELTIAALHAGDADAAAEAARVLSIVSTRRDFIRLRLAASEAAGLDLTSVVSVQVPRFGWSAGKLFRVLGLAHDLARNTTTLWLWG